MRTNQLLSQRMSEQRTDHSRERSGNGRLEPSPALSHSGVKPQWAQGSQLHRRRAYKSLKSNKAESIAYTLWFLPPTAVRIAASSHSHSARHAGDPLRPPPQAAPGTGFPLVGSANGTYSHAGSCLRCRCSSRVRTQTRRSPFPPMVPSALAPGQAVGLQSYTNPFHAGCI